MMMDYILFANKAERQQHTQLRQIPEAVWQHYFRYNQVNETELSLLKQDDFKDALESIHAYPNQNDKDLERLWLCLLLRFPEAIYNELIIEASLEADTFDTVFQLACATARSAFLDLLKEDKLAEYLTYDLLYTVCRLGNIGSAKWHLKDANQSERQTEISRLQFRVMHAAAASGNLSLVLWLYKQLTPAAQKALFDAKDGLDIFAHAAGSGNIKMFEWLLVKAKRRCPPEPQEAFDQACCFGQTAMAQRLLILIQTEAPKLQLDLESAFVCACCSGNLETAVWVLDLACGHDIKKERALIQDTKYMAFRYACDNNCLGIAQWLYAKLEPQQQKEAISAMGFFAYRSAEENNFTSLVQWLLSVCPAFLIEKIKPQEKMSQKNVLLVQHHSLFSPASEPAPCGNDHESLQL